MKTIAINIFALFLTVSAFAQNQKWVADIAHSRISFEVTHSGISEVEGRFERFEASCTTSKADFSDAVFDITIDVASIDTDFDKRDVHLRSSDFFNVETYPKITFKSLNITKVADKKYKLTGDLTMKNVTKSVSFDMTLTGTSKNMLTQKSLVGFKLTSSIKRSDFNITFASPLVGDEVQIKAVGEFSN